VDEADQLGRADAPFHPPQDGAAPVSGLLVRGQGDQFSQVSRPGQLVQENLAAGGLIPGVPPQVGVRRGR
jgi:hypothetical protein